MSLSVNWTAWTYDRHRVVKYDDPSVVPPDEISTGTCLALTTLLWVMACVESTTAVTAASIPAGVL